MNHLLKTVFSVCCRMLADVGEQRKRDEMKSTWRVVDVGLKLINWILELFLIGRTCSWVMSEDMIKSNQIFWDDLLVDVSKEISWRILEVYSVLYVLLKLSNFPHVSELLITSKTNQALRCKTFKQCQVVAEALQKLQGS